VIATSFADFLTGDLKDWVIDVIDALGYFGVGLLVFLENIFPPIPSEIVLPAAGIHANEGRSVFGLMLLAATLGSLIGAWVLYLGAALIGETRLRAFVRHHGRWVGVQERDLDRADAWFDRRQAVAVLVCRCIPLVRSLVSIPAGFRRMDPLRFTLYTALGSAVWNGALITVGYAASEHWDTVERTVGYVQYVVVAIIVLAVVRFVWRRLPRSGRTDRSRPEPERDRV
jgi:membrane protein DedA with SNARE-associated domain